MKDGISRLLTYREEFIDPSLPTGLWWCGNAEDTAVVGINAVCKAILAEWSEMPSCREFVGKFQYVFVVTPDDAEREEITCELQKWSPVPILVADKASFRGNESVKALFENCGMKAVEGLLLGAVELPKPGLLDLSQVETDDEKDRPRCMSGLLALDYCVGGFRGGELSVWTGKRGEGKSTLLGQLLGSAVNQNQAVCAYSGELPAKQFKRFIMPQLAGPDNLVKKPDPKTGRTDYIPTKTAQKAIDQWMERRFLLTDIRQSNAHDEDNILSLFEYAYRKYGCSVYLVDNIMTASLKGEAELGYWRAQSAFTQRLSAFAKRHDVHVHLVAHPKKTGGGRLEADDIGGSGDITNRADNVFSVERAPEGDSCAARIRILKVRENGCRETVALDFDERSRRYFDVGSGPHKKYTWEAYLNGHG